MTERAVVIGSNSFSGSHFVQHALEGGLEVLGLSRSPEPDIAFLPYRWETGGARSGTFRFAQMDLNHDTDRIAEALADFRPDFVINFAAQSMVAESWLNPDHWYQTNVLANVRLHERLRRFDFLKKYVHVSTPEVYGTCAGNVREDAPYNPSTPYAASRAACDLHLMTFLKRYQFPVVFTRSANVYGPGQQLYRIIPRAILSIRTGRRLPLHGGGHSVRSFVHARDVADGTLRVAREASPGEIYHFSTPSAVSIRSLVATLCQMLGVEFGAVVDIVDERPGKDAAYLLDSSKARTTLGWTDAVPLERGLQETIAWVAKHLEHLARQPWDYQHKP